MSAIFYSSGRTLADKKSIENIKRSSEALRLGDLADLRGHEEYGRGEHRGPYDPPDEVDASQAAVESPPGSLLGLLNLRGRFGHLDQAASLGERCHHQEHHII